MAIDTGEWYYSGQGDFVVAERTTAGKPKGFTYLGNVSAMTVDIEITKFEHKESRSGQRAVDLTIVQEKKGTFTMTAEKLDSTNMALFLWGAETAPTGAAVSDEAVTAYLDKICVLANPNVDGVQTFTVNGPGGTPTYVLNTDYTVDYVNGYIIPLSTGSISEDEALEISYTYKAREQVDAFTVTSLERYMRFHGLNTVVDGRKVVIDFFKASLDPLKGYELINEEIAQLEITGNLLYDSLQTGTSKFFKESRFDV